MTPLRGDNCWHPWGSMILTTRQSAKKRNVKNIGTPTTDRIATGTTTETRGGLAAADQTLDIDRGAPGDMGQKMRMTDGGGGEIREIGGGTGQSPRIPAIGEIGEIGVRIVTDEAVATGGTYERIVVQSDQEKEIGGPGQTRGRHLPQRRRMIILQAATAEERGVILRNVTAGREDTTTNPTLTEPPAEVLIAPVATKSGVMRGNGTASLLLESTADGLLTGRQIEKMPSKSAPAS